MNSKDKVWHNVNCLSTDHKPNSPGEFERIKSQNGLVSCYVEQNGNQVGPMRVWKTDTQGPGLAMSRSIGDYVAETVGVIALPDVQFHKRNSMIDKAIIICSDGLSDFLSEDDMYYIIKPFYGVADTEEASC